MEIENDNENNKILRIFINILDNFLDYYPQINFEIKFNVKPKVPTVRFKGHTVFLVVEPLSGGVNPLEPLRKNSLFFCMSSLLAFNLLSRIQVLIRSCCL